MQAESGALVLFKGRFTQDVVVNTIYICTMAKFIRIEARTKTPNSSTVKNRPANSSRTSVMVCDEIRDAMPITASTPTWRRAVFAVPSVNALLLGRPASSAYARITLEIARASDDYSAVFGCSKC